MPAIPVNLKVHDGHYLQAQNGGGAELSARGPWPKEWETFWLVPADARSNPLRHGSRVHLRSLAGQYVQAVNGGGTWVSCAGPWGKEWETFTLVLSPGQEHLAVETGISFGLRAANGQYLCAESGGGREVMANRSWMAEWETFQLEVREQPPLSVNIRTSDGTHYLQAQNGGGGELSARGPWPLQWETFEVLRGDPLSPFGITSGTHVHLRTENGHLVQVGPIGTRATAAGHRCSDRASTWTMLEIPTREGSALETGKHASFRTFAGGYLRADGGGGGPITVVAGPPGATETFQLAVRTGRPIPAPGASVDASWALIRDRITIDATLAANIRADAAGAGLAPGSTILLVGREIRHAPGFVLSLPEYDLVLVAEAYDANGGAIDTTPPPRSAASVGGPGPTAPPADFLFGQPGGTGGKGGRGPDGDPGRNVTLLCGKAKDVSVRCDGGRGGAGGTGGRGGDGGEVGYATLVGGGQGDTAYGSSGGSGGEGGEGGRGGNGGHVTIHWAEGNVSQVSSLSGAGGAGGAGGTKTGEEEFIGSQYDNYPYGPWTQYLRTPQDGPTGPTGRPGEPGIAGPVIAYRFGSADFLERASSLLGPFARKWGEYRARVADYHHRRYAPGVPSTALELSQAIAEAEAARVLAPEAASEIVHRLRTGQVPVGLFRDHDVVPSFDDYEQFVTRYAPIVQSIFDSARFLITNAQNVGIASSRLQTEVRHATDSLTALEAERVAAVIDEQNAKEELEEVAKRTAELQQQIQAKTALLQRERVRVETGIDLEDVGSALEIAVAIVSVAVPAAPFWKALGASISLITKAGEALDLSLRSAKPISIEELEKEAGGLKDLGGNGKELVSRVKALVELVRARNQNDAPIQKEIAELLKKAAELVFERARAERRLERAKRLLEAVDARRLQAERDVQELARQVQTLSQDVRIYANVVPQLLRLGRTYGDLLMKYVFLAARAADIYALQDLSSTVAFDYGMVDPDVEEDALAALRRNSAPPVASFVGDLVVGLSRIPQIMVFADAVRNTDAALDSEASFFYPLAPPGALQAFAAAPSAEFDIALDSLLPGRAEAKIESVHLALVGATAVDPVILCRLEHSGTAWIRLADGSTRELLAPPRDASIEAALAPLTSVSSSAGALVPAFWGRSPAARWRLRIEPAVMARSGVVLSGLTGIQVKIGYRARVL